MSDENLTKIEHLEQAPVSASTAIAALAMNFALKWFDMTMVKDGTLYQQYKMEQRNITVIDFPDILKKAAEFEAWLINSDNRQMEQLTPGLIEELSSKMVSSILNATEPDGGEEQPEKE